MEQELSRALNHTSWSNLWTEDLNRIPAPLPISTTLSPGDHRSDSSFAGDLQNIFNHDESEAGVLFR